jgi:hypothetical protein
MSKKKQTPAEVAQTLAKFIAKQEETLRSFPVGPMSNTARRNLKKGREALALLQGKNEEMRMQVDPNAMPMAQMVAGGETVPASKSGFEVGLRQYNPGALESGKGELGKLSDERFATFATLEDGWNALTRQLTRYQKGLTPGTSGDMTLSEAMGKYAPKYENDTAGYITKITSGTGATPNTPIKDIDINKWATAISRVESPQAFVALENAGLLDSEAASVYTNDALVRQARESGAAEKFTTSVPQIDVNRDTTTYSDIFNSPVTQNAPTASTASAPAEPAAEPPRADIPPELNDDILFEKTLEDPKVLQFLQRNNLSTDVLQTAIGGDYVDIPNRAAFDANIRRVARNYIDTRNELIAGPPPSTEKDKTGDAIGWSEATGISRERYAELLTEATKEFPDQALAYQPGAPGEEGTFTPNAATMLPTAVSEAEVPRDAQGRPIFTGMQAKINYDNFNAGGEDFQRRGIEMSDAINSARNQFAEDFLLPLTVGSLGVAGLPTIAAAGSSLAGSPFGTALGQVGRQFLSNQVVGPGATAASRLGALTTAAGVTKGLADATGVRTPFDDPNAPKQNAFQVANNPNLTGLQKAEYFAMLGIELSPAIFESPTMIRNIFRGRPSDFPGSFGSYLNARRGLINTADDLGDAARVADDAFDTTQINRGAFKNTAAKAEAKAVQAEAKAAAKPTKANQNAAQKARAKADTAKSNDAVALRNQQADNARRLNARGRAGVADDELAAFNRRYNAPREPYNFGSTGFLSNTGNRIPAAVAGTGLLMNSPTESALNTPDTVPQVQFVQPEIIPPATTAPTTAPTTPVTTPTPTPAVPDSDGDGIPDTIDVDAGTGTDEPTTTPVTSPVKVDAQPTQTGFNMKGPGLLAAIPAMASAASVGIQRRALNQMQAPQRPIISDIPAFNYESNLGQQLQDVRDSTQAMSRMDGVQGPQAAAARQGLLAQRLRQEQRLRGMDNEAMQQARARYDAMAQQARMAQDAIRTNYQNDLTQFNNQKAMLDASIKQQPLNVLSATAQDYLKNVYQPNLAAQLEGLGRQYDTTFPNQD